MLVHHVITRRSVNKDQWGTREASALEWQVISKVLLLFILYYFQLFVKDLMRLEKNLTSPVPCQIFPVCPYLVCNGEVFSNLRSTFSYIYWCQCLFATTKLSVYTLALPFRPICTKIVLFLPDSSNNRTDFERGSILAYSTQCLFQMILPVPHIPY